MLRLFSFTLAYLCTFISTAQHAEELLNLYYQGDYTSVTNVLIDDESLEPQSLFIIANAFHKLGDVQSALMYYEKCELIAHELDDYFLNRAICEISTGDLVSAERHLFMYADFVGNHPMIHYYFSVIDFEVMEYKSSLATLDLALELNPEYFEAWYLKGAIYIETERYEKAAECFNQVLEINPTHSSSELNLAICNVYLKNYKNAFNKLDYIINQNSDLKSEALFYRAEAHFYMHNIDKACEDWKQSASLGDEFAKKNITLICEKGKTSRHRQRKITRIAL